MKQVRNRRTGDVGELDFDSKEGVFIVVYYDLNTKEYVKHFYRGIKGLSAEWEDYKEPKEYWYIRDHTSSVGYAPADNNATAKYRKEIVGNYFETKEEAELAVRKLKAWKRLKDKGFSIHSWDYEFDMVDKPSQTIILRASAIDSSNTDLDLLFGGGE